MLDRAERAAAAGDLSSANELLRTAARVQEEQLGPLHPDLANTLNNLAIVAERTGRAGEAETFYRRAVAIASASLPPDDPMVAASRQNLEDFCRARGVPIDLAPVTATAREAGPPPDESAPKPPVPPETAVTGPATDRGVSPAPLASDSAASGSVAGWRAPVASQLEQPAARWPDTPRRRIAWAVAAVVVVALVFLVLSARRSSRDGSTPAQTSEPGAASSPESVPPSRSADSNESARRVPASGNEPPAPPLQKSGQPPGDTSRRDDRDAASNRQPAPTAPPGSVTLAAAEVCRNFSTSGRSWRCDPAGDSAAPGRLVLYTRVKSARDDVVVHRWYRGNTLRQSVRLQTRANATEGYRTYSRQLVDAGAWRVEVRSASGSLLHEQRFTVR